MFSHSLLKRPPHLAHNHQSNVSLNTALGPSRSPVGGSPKPFLGVTSTSASEPASASPSATPAVWVAPPLLRAGVHPGSSSGPEATPHHHRLSAGCPPRLAARTLFGLRTLADSQKSPHSEELLCMWQTPTNAYHQKLKENFFKYQLI